MAHVPQRIIRAANRRTQRRLRAVLDANAGHDPGHRTTRLYWQSERLLDALKGEPFDLTPDPGDHHVYVSAAR